MTATVLLVPGGSGISPNPASLDGTDIGSRNTKTGGNPRPRHPSCKQHLDFSSLGRRELSHPVALAFASRSINNVSRKQVPVVLASLNGANRILGNAKVSSQSSARNNTPHQMDVLDLSIGQLAYLGADAAGSPSIVDGEGDVLQIFWAVVSSIKVSMVDHRPVGTWAEKSQCHERMNEPFAGWARRDAYSEVTSRVQVSFEDAGVAPGAPDSPMGRCLILRLARNRKPYFCRINTHRKPNPFGVMPPAVSAVRGQFLGGILP